MEEYIKNRKPEGKSKIKDDVSCILFYSFFFFDCVADFIIFWAFYNVELINTRRVMVFFNGVYSRQRFFFAELEQELRYQDG